MLHKDLLLTEIEPGEFDFKEFPRRLVATQTLVCICSHKFIHENQTVIRMIHALSQLPKTILIMIIIMKHSELRK